jgi:hypothetical protein
MLNPIVGVVNYADVNLKFSDQMLKCFSQM